MNMAVCWEDARNYTWRTSAGASARRAAFTDSVLPRPASPRTRHCRRLEDVGEVLTRAQQGLGGHDVGPGQPEIVVIALVSLQSGRCSAPACSLGPRRVCRRTATRTRTRPAVIGLRAGRRSGRSAWQYPVRRDRRKPRPQRHNASAGPGRGGARDLAQVGPLTAGQTRPIPGQQITGYSTLQRRKTRRHRPAVACRLDQLTVNRGCVATPERQPLPDLVCHLEPPTRSTIQPLTGASLPHPPPHRPR